MSNEPFGLITASGAEAISDDRSMKYILRQEVHFGQARHLSYTAYCYVKEGTGWQWTTLTTQYSSIDEFVKALLIYPGFSRAAKEIQDQSVGSLRAKSQ